MHAAMHHAYAYAQQHMHDGMIYVYIHMVYVYVNEIESIVSLVVSSYASYASCDTMPYLLIIIYKIVHIYNNVY